ncbi:MAG TPA: aminomethyltransferase family protein [Nitrospiria bacterium]|nr:aminomethyltransferase family protein [Nitrospiria bacterium]
MDDAGRPSPSTAASPPSALPLADEHRRLQARWTTVGGREVPDHYGDPVAEHLAVRGHAGAADLSARGLLRVTGVDRAKYLHSILTNDILALTAGQGCYAALLDVKGHLQADMRLFALENALLIDLDPMLTAGTVPALKRYIVIYKVKLEEISHERLHLALWGPKSDDWLTALFGRVLPPLPDYHHVTWTWQDAPVEVIRLSETGEAGAHLLVPAAIGAPLWRALMDCGRPIGAVPVGARAVESLRIEAGVPRFGAELGPSHFPAEAGIEQAISYTKGCYLGQETTMRIKTQGSVNRRLVGLLVEGAGLPAAGSPLFAEGQQVGTITSALDSPTLRRRIALGYVQKGFFAAGTRLALADQTPATVTPLPFYHR